MSRCISETLEARRLFAAAPVAVDDFYTINEDERLLPDVPGVLINDTDPNGLPLTAVFDTNPTHGFLNTSPSGGSFIYVPDANYHGTDSFTYHDHNSSAISNTATVHIEILPVNDAPVAGGDGEYDPSFGTNGTVQTGLGIGIDLSLLMPNGDILVGGQINEGTAAGGQNFALAKFHADGSVDTTFGINGRVTTDFNGATDQLQMLRVLPDGKILAAGASAGWGIARYNSDGTPDTTFGNGTGKVLISTGVRNAFCVELSTQFPGKFYVGGQADFAIARFNSDGTLDTTFGGNGTGLTSLITGGRCFQVVELPNGKIQAAGDGSAAVLARYNSDGTFDTTFGNGGVLRYDFDGRGGSHARSMAVLPDGRFVISGDILEATGSNFDVMVARFNSDGSLDPTFGNGVGWVRTDGGANEVPQQIAVAPDGKYVVVVGGTIGVVRYNTDGSLDTTFGGDGIASTPSGGQAVAIQPDGKIVTCGGGILVRYLESSTDGYRTGEDTTLTISSPSAGVLANDSDVDGDPIHATLVSGPSHGSMVLNLDGTFSYTPFTDYNGLDSFSYVANDGQANSNVSTVMLNVTDVNDAPTGANDSLANSAEDTNRTITFAQLLANDVRGPANESGQTLTISSVTSLVGGTVAISGTNVIFTPTANYNGPASFRYTVQDNGTTNGSPDPKTSTATVNFTITEVNDPPVGVNDSLPSSAEDTLRTISFATLLANDSKGPANESTQTLTITNVSGAVGGTVTIAGTNVLFNPTANYNGPASFVYTLQDNGTTNGAAAPRTATATVSFTVTPVDDAPVITAVSITPANPLTNDLLTANVSSQDTENDPVTYMYQWFNSATLLAGETSSTLDLSHAGNGDKGQSISVRVTPNDGTTDGAPVTSAAVTVGNTAPVATSDSTSVLEDHVLNGNVVSNDTDADGDTLTAILDSGTSSGVLHLNADGSFTYTPAADFNGSDSFTYHTSDGTVESSSTTVSITITPVNDDPSAVADSAQVNEDGAVTTNVIANDSAGPANEDQSLTVTSVTQGAHGAVTNNLDGTITYTPNPHFFGSDSYSYTVQDSDGGSATASVSITVNHVNHAPVASGGSVSGDEDTAISGTVPVTDQDANTSLTYSIVTGPSHGTITSFDPATGAFTYQGNANYNGADSFTYQASDGDLSSAIATESIVINAVNDAPVAAAQSISTAEDTAKAGQVSATDIDNTAAQLTYSLVGSNGGAAHGLVVLNPDGTYTYSPAQDFNGTDSFTFRASDGSLGSDAVISINVTAVNDTPVAAAQSISTAEDNAEAGQVSASDIDNSAAQLSYSLVGSNGGAAHGLVTLNPDGSFTYSPAHDFNGTDSFTFRASDGSLSSDAVVSINVTAVNDAPVAQNNTYLANQNATLLVGAPGVLGNDSDVEGSALTAILVNGPSHGTLVFNSDGSLTYTPAEDFTGTDTFTYKANDGQLNSNLATVSINVSGAQSGASLIADPCGDGNALLVVGTAGNDDIHISGHNGTYQIVMNGTSLGSFSAISRIIVQAGAGNDNVQVEGSVDLPTWLFGDSGNDRLNAGAAGSVVVGGSGDDELLGGQGRDVMIGGLGADHITGNAGDDILIAGRTDFDQNLSAICNIVDEWTRSDAIFHTRVGQLEGTIAGGFNGSTYLNATTVHDDGAIDQIDVLVGSAGDDWYIYDLGTGDRANGVSSVESRDAITNI